MNVWLVQIVGIFLTLFSGLIIIQQVSAGGKPIQKKLRILGKKQLLPKKIFPYRPTSFKKVNTCKKSVKIILSWFRNVGFCRKIFFFGKNQFLWFFGKSDFSPKIPNFCRIGLPLAKTYWMIVSPQKRVKKMPTICTCQTFIYYVNRLKTNFEVIFKAHFRAKKISKIIMDPQTFKTHHRLSGNADLDGRFSLSLSETAC